jgi:putative DNA primase/helicase
VVCYEQPRVWSVVVFNAMPIDGLPPAPLPPMLAEWERHEGADAILAHSGAAVRHVSGDHTFYRLAEDAITLPGRGQFPSEDSYFAAALHVLGRWTGHPSRLNRDLTHPFGSEGDAREELRAGIASLMLGEQLGIGLHPGHHVAYVGSWIRMLEREPREIFRAAADAERIAVCISAFEMEQELQSDQAREAGDFQASERSAAVSGPDDLATAAPAAAEVRAPTLIREDHPAMTTSDDRTYLAVPYDEKDDAKARGAKWDRQAKAWYVPAGMDVDTFSAWLPAHGQVHVAVDADPREEFALALRESGLRIDGPPEMDGAMHRVSVDGDKGRERSGAYVAHLDGRPAGRLYPKFPDRPANELEGVNPCCAARRPGSGADGGGGGTEAAGAGGRARAHVRAHGAGGGSDLDCCDADAGASLPRREGGSVARLAPGCGWPTVGAAVRR